MGRLVLPALLFLVSGCASLATAPPAPPLVAELLDEPTEYQWRPFKWIVGTSLFYRIQLWVEVGSGSQKESRNVAFEMTMAAVERTTKGLTRVDLATPGTGTVGAWLIDDESAIKDVIVTKPEFKDIATIAQDPMYQHFRDRSMILGHEYDVEVTTAEVGGIEEKYRSLLPDSVRATYQFGGYRRLGGTRVAAIRTRVPNPLETAVEDTESGFTMRSVSVDAMTYIAADAGYLVALYMVTTVEGEGQRQPVVLKVIMAMTLDLGRSRGIR